MTAEAIPRLLPLWAALTIAAMTGVALSQISKIPWPWVRSLIRVLTALVLFRTAYEAGEISTQLAALMFGLGIWAMIEKMEKGIKVKEEPKE